MDNKFFMVSKKHLKGEDSHKLLSLRIQASIFEEIETLSAQTNRSRNELINLLLAEALKFVIVTDDDDCAAPPGIGST